MNETGVQYEEVEKLYRELDQAAESGGYHLNPDHGDTRELVKGLIVNEKRYGYRACPCREAAGSRAKDLDIICPCDYRDPDLDEYGTCFCGLYVSGEALEGKKQVEPIPERRPAAADPGPAQKASRAFGGLKYPIWRCKVCGYLCARAHPPETCPICKAEKDRFEVLA